MHHAGSAVRVAIHGFYTVKGGGFMSAEFIVLWIFLALIEGIAKMSERY
jgi:hypothetical protein